MQTPRQPLLTPYVRSTPPAWDPSWVAGGPADGAPRREWYDAGWDFLYEHAGEVQGGWACRVQVPQRHGFIENSLGLYERGVWVPAWCLFTERALDHAGLWRIARDHAFTRLRARYDARAALRALWGVRDALGLTRERWVDAMRGLRLVH